LETGEAGGAAPGPAAAAVGLPSPAAPGAAGEDPARPPHTVPLPSSAAVPPTPH